MSILTGIPGGGGKPSPKKRDHAPDWEQMERLMLDQARLTKEARTRELEIERLTAELAAANARNEAAAERERQMQRELGEQRALAAEGAAARQKLPQLQERLELAREELSRIESQRAHEAATAAALREQLAQALAAGERDAAQARGMNGRMSAIEQALQALPERVERGVEQGVGRIGATVTAALAVRAIPAPPTYEMQVTKRDGSNRPQTVRLRPVKE